jgi:hypothetical protein
MSYVFTTFHGRRFHADPDCLVLDLGRYLTGSRYDVMTRLPSEAIRVGYTACRVCVPPALALPATGETYGHEPVDEYAGTPEGERGVSRIVCARCMRWTQWPEVGLCAGHRVTWPCTSAVVLGLVVTDADRWNAAYPVGTPVVAWPGARTDEPLWTRTRTPAWRLGHGASVVSVDGYAGGICLTHVDPRGGA